MSSARALVLPLLLVLNGVLSIAIAERAAVLRRSWQVYSVRLEAQARLKNITSEETRAARGNAGAHGPPPTEPDAP